MPVTILAGEEEFLIALRVKALKEKLVDPAWASFNFTRIDNPGLMEVVDAAAMVPFGPGNKVVLFEQCALFTKKRSGSDEGSGSSKSSKVIDDFESALSSVAPNTHLIFACVAKLDKTLKTTKIVDKLDKERKITVEDFPKVKYYAGSRNDELLTFCNREAHRAKACIDDDAAFYLAESTEVNLRQISSEIEKAAVYIFPEERIKLEHVQLLSPHFSHVFALMEHWAYGHRSKVLESISELASRQVSPHMVLAAMQTTLSKWVYYKTEYERAAAVPGGSREVRKREVPLKDLAYKIDPRLGFMIEQDLRRIKLLSLETLVKKKRQLTDIEFALKSGQMPESHALEIFFTR